MNDHLPTDWTEFWVRFVCGAIFGTVTGIGLWAELEPARYAGLAVPTAMLIAGGLAAWLGDRFWFTALRFWL